MQNLKKCFFINSSIYRKLIGNHFDNELIIKVNFQAKTQNTLWFELLKCEDLQFFSVLYLCKINMFRLWLLIRQNKQSEDVTPGFFFLYFVTFYGPKDFLD